MSSYPMVAAAVVAALVAIGNAQAAPDEMIVEATRRAQNIQDVPIAITAISAGEIEKLQIVETKDIGSMVPNLQTYAVTANGAGMQVHARGASVQNPGFITSESPVGIYEDDVYRGRLATANLDLLDVDHIEVLRGPQATLYGRNTMAGAIKIVTRTPGEDNEYIDLLGSVGNYDTWKLGGAFGGVLIDDTLAGSVAVGYNKRDKGYIKNPLDGFDAGRWDNTAIRGKLRWYGIDNLDVTLMGFYIEAKNDGYNGVPYQPFPAPPATLADAANGTPLGGFYDNYSPADPTSPNGRQNVGKTRQTGTTLDLTYTFPAAEFRSITAYTDIDDLFGFDLAGGGAFGTPGLPGLQIDSTSNMKQFTQEFHLYGTAYDDRLDWIAGLFYLREDGDQNYGGLSMPFFDFLETTAARTSSYSLFAEGTWHFSTRWSVTAGARFTDEQKKFSLDCTGETNPSTTGSCTPTTDGAFSSQLTKNYSEFTPRVSVNYQPGDDVLLYASVSRGFQAGGFQTLCFGNLQCADEPYDPQEVWSYEVGYKGTIADTLTIDTAVFFAQYADIQQTVIQDVEDMQGNVIGATFPTKNIGRSNVWGVELDSRWAATDQLNFFLTAGFMSNHYGSLSDTSGAAAAGAKDLPSTPKFTGRTGFDYTIPFSSAFEAYFGADVNYSDSYYAEATNTLEIKSYTRLNGFVGVGAPDGRWLLTVEGKNLIDDDDNVSGIVAEFATNIRTPLPPREIYGTLRLRF